MGQTAGPTLAVQIGFVAGALGSAGFGLADAGPSRRLFVIAALSGTATNAALGGRVDDGYRSRRWPFRGAVVAVLPKPDWPGSEEPGGLSTCGYLGHMWELYAMWTWTAAFLLASATVSGSSYGSVPIITFAVIAIGGAGGRLAGIWADRFGRPLVAGGSMAVSGVCALVTPVVFGRSALSVVPLFLVWGIRVVADSAQFSAMVTEMVHALAQHQREVLSDSGKASDRARIHQR